MLVLSETARHDQRPKGHTTSPGRRANAGPCGISQAEERGYRRRPPEEFFVTRAAREAMSPINNKLSAWHSRVAQFAAMAERLRSHGRYEARYAADADSLAVAVTVEQERLADCIAELPDEVQKHSHVRDTERALGDLSARLDAARRLL